MNAILKFLDENRQRLDLERIGVRGELSFVMVTPRFRASSHVVFIILVEGRSEPVLVVKVPRILGGNSSVEREVHNLRLAQMVRPTGFDSIPFVVAFEESQGHALLVETALDGSPMDTTSIRGDFVGCCNSVTNWLVELHRCRLPNSPLDSNWFDRLVEEPLRRLESVFGSHSEEKLLFSQTRSLASSLAMEKVPLVFEHGDLSHPNVLLLRRGGIGVLDWELAEPQGLPGVDLFFFLAYAAFCRHEAQKTGIHVPAFRDAFFGRSAWGIQHVLKYADQVGLAMRFLAPLFVLCWARYLSGLVLRITDGGGTAKRIGPETAAWLRTNRYYALWKYALENCSELDWSHSYQMQRRST